MPRFAAYLLDYQVHTLAGYLLPGAQPVWAEILTANPWFRNGCTAYARPTDSLNKLAIVTEKDLLGAAILLDDQFSDDLKVTVNLPLLLPRRDRIWLSDGSLPIHR